MGVWFLEVHFAQPMGDILTGDRMQIGDIYRAAPVEPGKGCRTPEGLWGWLL